MTPGLSPHRRLARRSSLVALLLAAALAPASALASSSPPSSPDLSARLAELARPAVRSASRAEQAARLSLAVSGPGSLLRAGGRVLVDVRFEGAAAAAAGSLRAAGAEIVQVSRRYEVATVAVRPEDLPEIGALSRVSGVTELLKPLVRGVDCGGAVRSEGDSQLNAASARQGFAVDGSGVTIGILSDSFDRDAGAATHAVGDVVSGDLPGPASPCGSTAAVNVLDDSEAAGSDEGRAMAQIVHDLAPGAAIDFAGAFGGELAFAANIRALAAAGARVIADDVTYLAEPFFQDGPVAVAVNEVAGAGVSYFSAAGNDNLIDAGGRDVGSWEAPQFRTASSCPPALALAVTVTDCVDFDPGAGDDSGFGITVAKGATLTVDLQWAQPWNGVTTDLDAFLLDSTGKPLTVEQGGKKFLVAGVEDNIATQRPVEVLQWENKTSATVGVQLAIDNCFGPACNEGANGATPRLKFALLQNGSGVTAVEYPESAGGDVVGPTVFGHAGAVGAIAAGAVPYNGGDAPERYSSRGPVTHYFGPVTGSAPAAAIPAQTISKPDLAATDCGVTTFFFQPNPSSPAPFRFCGTSAAAPHAAAVAALVRQANPGISAAQLRDDLTATARPVGAFGPEAVGAGLVDAYGAVAALALPPAVAITKPPPPLSRNRWPAIEFSASRPVAFSCEVDGAAAQPCASPFGVPAALGDGGHWIAVRGVDQAGRSGSSSVAFSIDTRAPRTKIVKHPPKLVRTVRPRIREAFRFRSNEAEVSFACKVDGGPLRPCGRRLSRRFGEGRHVLRVRAGDRAGNVDRTAAVFRFRVERIGG